jgi:hypothetical protein
MGQAPIEALELVRLEPRRHMNSSRMFDVRFFNEPDPRGFDKAAASSDQIFN